MDKGLHDPGAILKIGFLNDKVLHFVEEKHFIGESKVLYNVFSA